MAKGSKRVVPSQVKGLKIKRALEYASRARSASSRAMKMMLSL